MAFQMPVPQPDGSEVPIECLPVNESRKTLGTCWTNPAGDCHKQLDVLHDNLEKWTNQLLVGRLPANFKVGVSQLLPATLGESSPVEDMKQAEDVGGPLQKIYYKMLPFLGVN